MTGSVNAILRKADFDKEDLITLLSCNEDEKKIIFEKAAELKSQFADSKISKFGLINITNFCDKDCFYCKNRKSNYKLYRYCLSEKEVLDSVKFAHKNNFDSVVFHTGESENIKYIKLVEKLITKISQSKRYKIDIILSIGEQIDETYKKWRKSKIKSYLLRIKTSNPDLYKKNHPDNKIHELTTRINTIKILKKTGFKTGTGILAGLPFQTLEDLANDILFINKMKFDFCEVIPFIEQENTPAYFLENLFLPFEKRIELTEMIIAILRIMMNDIKIASFSHFQSTETGVKFNIKETSLDIKMINITPKKYFNYYSINNTERIVADPEIQYVYT